jgi:hypothetical protein
MYHHMEGTPMTDAFAFHEVDGFRLKLWRGESMCLLGFDVDDPEDDFVGFAVEYQRPGRTRFVHTRRRSRADHSGHDCHDRTNR